MNFLWMFFVYQMSGIKFRYSFDIKKHVPNFYEVRMEKLYRKKSQNISAGYTRVYSSVYISSQPFKIVPIS